MTFEEYMFNTYGAFWDKGLFPDGEQINAIKHAWNAAKGDTEKVKEEVLIYKSELVGDWIVSDLNYAVIDDLFSSKEEAQQWAIENGYRIAEEG